MVKGFLKIDETSLIGLSTENDIFAMASQPPKKSRNKIELQRSCNKGSVDFFTLLSF